MGDKWAMKMLWKHQVTCDMCNYKSRWYTERSICSILAFWHGIRKGHSGLMRIVASHKR